MRTLSFVAATVLVAFATLAKSSPFLQRMHDLSTRDNDQQLNGVFQELIEKFRKIMKNGDPAREIPVLDPIQIDHQDIQIKESYFNVKITNTTVSKLSTFTVKSLDVKLSKLQCKLQIDIPELNAKSLYDADGTALSILPIYGKGNASLDAKGVSFTVQSKLVVTEVAADKHILSLNDFDSILSFKNLTVRLGNFLGGGDLGDLANDFLNAAAPKIFERLEPSLHAEIIQHIQDYLNGQLKDIPLEDIIDDFASKRIGSAESFNAMDQADLLNKVKQRINSIGQKGDTGNKVSLVIHRKGGNSKSNANKDSKTALQKASGREISPLATEINDYLDQVLINVRERIVDQGYDDISVSQYKTYYSFTWYGITITVYLTVHDGHLLGLETIRREGDAYLDITENGIEANAILAVDNIEGFATATVTVFGFDMSIDIDIVVQYATFFAAGSLNSDTNKLTIDEFKFLEFGDVSITIIGIPDWLAWILEYISELILNYIKSWLGTLADSTIKKFIQDVLDKTEIPKSAIEPLLTKFAASFGRTSLVNGVLTPTISHSEFLSLIGDNKQKIRAI